MCSEYTCIHLFRCGNLLLPHKAWFVRHSVLILRFSQPEPVMIPVPADPRRLPVLFIGHGSPMNAIEPTPFTHTWRTLGDELRAQYAIRAILCVSAHWVTRGTWLSGGEHPDTFHDFGGFPEALYAVRYPAPGSPTLAQHIRQRLPHAGIDSARGFDHGTWSVLCHLFPAADVPVVQLSLDAELDVAGHYALGQALTPLREEGILIVASGNVVHNLRTYDWQQPHGEPYPWAEDTRTLVNRWMQDHSPDLHDGSRYPAAMAKAAPTPEHFYPLLYIAGARHADDQLHIFNDDIVGRSLSMTGYRLAS